MAYFHESEQINLAAGTIGKKDIKIGFSKRGICKAIALSIAGNTLPNEQILVKLTDKNGNTILPFIPYKMLMQRQGGNYEQSLVPVIFDKQNIVVTFNISTALQNQIKASLVFFFQNPEEYNKQKEFVKNTNQMAPFSEINSDTSNCTI